MQGEPFNDLFEFGSQPTVNSGAYPMKMRRHKFAIALVAGAARDPVVDTAIR
jgi:hypothetical protein